MSLKLTPYDPTGNLKARVGLVLERLSKEYNDLKDPGVPGDSVRGYRKVPVGRSSAWMKGIRRA